MKAIMKLLLASAIKGKGWDFNGYAVTVVALTFAVIAALVAVAVWKDPAVERGAVASAIGYGIAKAAKLLLRK